MLGIRKVNTTKTTHSQFWCDRWALIGGSLIDVVVDVIGILSFGRLTAEWSEGWYHFIYREKR